MPKCHECFYFAIGMNMAEKQLLECRRYAPRVIHGSGTGWSDSKWPKVEKYDWCGEFKPKE